MKRGIPISDSDLERIDTKALLDPAHRIRLKAYVDDARAKGLFESNHLFFNVMQTVGFVSNSARHRGLFPTLMRNSVLIDCGVCAPGRARPVHPLEHYAAMGFPVLVESETERCPFPVSSFSHQHMRHLTGNGMHVVAVGTWLQFALAVAVRKPHT